MFVFQNLWILDTVFRNRYSAVTLESIFNLVLFNFCTGTKRSLYFQFIHAETFGKVSRLYNFPTISNNHEIAWWNGSNLFVDQEKCKPVFSSFTKETHVLQDMIKCWVSVVIFGHREVRQIDKNVAKWIENQTFKTLHGINLP